MTRQPDPAIVRAVLAKHHDGDQPTACETCVLADEISRLRDAITRAIGISRKSYARTIRLNEIHDLLTAAIGQEQDR